MHVSPHENQAAQLKVEPQPQIERSGNQFRARYVVQNIFRGFGGVVYISSDDLVTDFIPLSDVQPTDFWPIGAGSNVITLYSNCLYKR